jgi:hypothetical protein
MMGGVVPLEDAGAPAGSLSPPGSSGRPQATQEASVAATLAEQRGQVLGTAVA